MPFGYEVALSFVGEDRPFTVILERLAPSSLFTALRCADDC